MKGKRKPPGSKAILEGVWDNAKRSKERDETDLDENTETTLIVNMLD